MNLNIVFTETTINFPDNFTANNSKVELLAKGFLGQGDSVTIINSIWGNKGLNQQQQTRYQGIPIYSFPRKNSKLLSFLVNTRKYIQLINEIKSKEQKNIVIMGGPYFFLFVPLAIFLRLKGFYVTITITEWAVGIKSPALKKFNYFLFDYLFGYFVNAIFPISSFLEKKIKHFKKQSLLIPILADFTSSFNPTYNNSNEKFFLLCSTLSYKKIVDFTIESFVILKQEYPDYKLVLVLSGTETQLNEVRSKIEELNLSESIEIFNQIAYNDLIQKYHKATALLIPLENTIQDKARFSHKIGEYISTKRPIITHAVGDINIYFKNGENAYIAKEFSPNCFAAKMKEVLMDLNKADKIGEAGYLTGKEYFNYENYSKKIHDFLMSIK